jgi:hypothetical protein
MKEKMGTIFKHITFVTSVVAICGESGSPFGGSKRPSDKSPY